MSRRTTAALNKELEDSEAKLKKSESMHLDAQSKIRELERSIHIHKNRDKEVRKSFFTLQVVQIEN